MLRHPYLADLLTLGLIGVFAVAALLAIVLVVLLGCYLMSRFLLLIFDLSE